MSASSGTSSSASSSPSAWVDKQNLSGEGAARQTDSPPCKPVRSPVIQLPLQVAVPTTALLDARRHPYRARMHVAEHTTGAFLSAGTMKQGGEEVNEGLHQHVPVSTEVPVPASRSTTGTTGTTTTTTTAAPSSSPSSAALVMDTLVRRFRATEGRLERWRHADAQSRAQAATLHRQRCRERQRAAEAKTCAEHHSGGGRPQSASAAMWSTVVERSKLVRAVQAWWSRTHLTGGAAASSATPAAGKKLGHTQPRVSGATRPTSWQASAGPRWLRRLSQSLTLSSERGQSTNVDLVAPSGFVHRYPARPADGDENDEVDVESGGQEGAQGVEKGYTIMRDVAPTAARGVAPGRLPPSSFLPASQLPVDRESSQSSTGSTSSESTGADEEHPDHSSDIIDAASDFSHTAVPPAVEDDGSFTLSWIRGLRRGRGGASSSSPSPLNTRADESFRSASRLLAKSRARFSRWLQRQQQRQAAKRAVLSERWRSFSQRGGSQAASGENHKLRTTTSLTATGVAQVPPLTTDTLRSAAQVSELEHTILQRPPSSWEEALPRTHLHGSGDGGMANAASAERASARAALQRAIAAATALAKRGKDAPAERTNEVNATVESMGTKPRLTLAEQREREHADALSHLSASLSALAQCRADAEAEGNVATDESDLGARVDAPPSARKTAVSSILSSSHPEYPTWKQTKAPASPTTHQPSPLPPVESEDEAEAFRSLLVDTTHTPHDAAMRLVYEEVMREVCSAQVRREVDAVVGVSDSAAERALTQWIERHLVSHLLSTPTVAAAAPTASVTGHGGLTFVGVLAHIRSGVAASMSCLRLDDADHRALASVAARRDSDVTAVSLTTSGYSITYRQLASLSADAWLNDQVINNYLQLLCEDVEQRQKQATGAVVHSVASMGTHFYAKVESELTQTTAKPDNAAHLPPLAAGSATLRWLRRRQHLLEPFKAADAESVRAVLVPVNIEAQHWALAVYFREDRRWVLYDSMSRSDRARQRGLRILSRLSHVWRECQRHYGHPVDEANISRSSGTTYSHTGSDGVTLLMAAPYTPSPTTTTSTTTSEDQRASTASKAPIDSLQPFGSLAKLHAAAKKLRRQEEALEEQQQQPGTVVKQQRTEQARSASSLLSATTLPASMLSDEEVEWFTDGAAHVPQQRNGNDCGVFVCQVAWCVAHGVAVSFTQTDVTLLRQVITLELLSTKLLRRYPTEHTSASADV